MAGKEFPLSVIIRGVDRVTAPMRAIAGAVGRFDKMIGAKFRAFGDKMGLPVLTAAAGRFGNALGDLGARLLKVGAGITAVVGLAVAGAWRVVSSFAEAGGEINDVSRSIGISAEKLQEWRYAAKQNGVEIEEFDRGVQILSRNLGKAFRGKGPADLLQAMGVKLKGVNGQFRTTEELLPQIADKLAKIKNPATRAAAAAELFGRSGVALLPMLLDGSKGLADYAKRARELGIVLSNEAVAQTDEFGDKVDDAKAALTGMRNTIGTALLPVLTKLTERFTDWLINIRPRLQAWFENFATNLPSQIEGLIKLFDDLREKVDPVVKVFGWLADKFGAANLIIAALAGALAIFLIPALYSTATAVYALGVALLTTPVGWITLGILALVAALVYLYFKSEAVRKVINLWAAQMLGVADVTAQLIDWLVKMALTIVDLTQKVFLFAAAFYNAFATRVKEAVDMAIGFIRDMVASITGLVPDWLKNLFSGKGSANINLTGAPMMRGGAAPLGAAAVGTGQAAAQNGEVKVKVDLNGLPPGSRVQTEQSGRPQFELNQGYAFGAGG